MTIANIAVSLEPMQQGRLTYLPMAPEKPGDDPQNQISLVGSLTNKQTSAVRVTSVGLIPAGASAPAQTYTLGLDIAPRVRPPGGPGRPATTTCSGRRCRPRWNWR